MTNVFVLASLAGCRDNGVSPISADSAAPATMQLAPTDRPLLSLSGGAADNVATDFTVSPRGGVYFVGNHAVVFPARSICDPSQSTYGADTWDDDCRVLSKSITIHAVVRNEGGREWVDFSPALRFAPSDNPSRWVWMFMYTPQAVNATGDLSAFNILYAERIGGVTANDAASDSSMRTYVDARSGVSFRRIKHFSGYTVSTGFTCDVTADGSCQKAGEGSNSTNP